MADLNTEFCGLNFKNPIVVASAEPGNSVDNMKKCIDYGAGGIIVKTIGDIPGMQTLTQHSKYAILNDRGEPIQGKVNRNFFFYSRSGYVSEYYKDWIPILAESQQYAAQNASHIIGNIASGTIDGWVMLARMPPSHRFRGPDRGRLDCAGCQGDGRVDRAHPRSGGYPPDGKTDPGNP
jgi:hypothetical protein